MATDGSPLGVWEVTDVAANQLGVSPFRAPGTHFEAEAGESIWDAIRRMTPWFDQGNPFHEITLSVGEYYPRIARPRAAAINDGILSASPSAALEQDVIAISKGQLAALTQQLRLICQTVHPAADTLQTYGHDIRNLLILACTEVEAHWKGVLSKNGFATSRPSTNSYVQLADPMKLGDYVVSFPRYPWLAGVSPFKGWGSTGNPTKELKWYDAYNKVKHDRENEFRESTLANAFEAVAACFVMMAAQYGFERHEYSELESFLQFDQMPKWEPADTYIEAYGKRPTKWTPVNYPFTS